MGIFQGPPHVTKTSKKLKPFRKKKRFQMGRLPTETELNERKMVHIKGRGGSEKLRLMRDEYADVSDAKGKSMHLKILEVIENGADVDYDRRGVITKGAIIRTDKGVARVTSSPGRAGSISAVLTSQKEK